MPLNRPTRQKTEMTDNAGMPAAIRPPARYQAIASDLIRRIEQGEFALGAQLPTELALCQAYGASRHTMRSALARLAGLGLIERRPGIGTKVAAPTPPMRYQQEVHSIEGLIQYSRSSQLRIRESATVIADAEVGRVLGVPAGTRVLRLFGVRQGEAAEAPICTTEIHLRPMPGLPRKQLLDLATASAAILRVLDLRRIHHVDQRFDAVPLPARHARLLAVRSGSAALRVLRVYHDGEGQVVACATSLHPSGRFAYTMRLERRSGG